MINVICECCAGVLALDMRDPALPIVLDGLINDHYEERGEFRFTHETPLVLEV